ncbi:MAG: hypothetical protein AMXMBFR13_41120 [Phycisphaerae bacterium]
MAAESQRAIGDDFAGLRIEESHALLQENGHVGPRRRAASRANLLLNTWVSLRVELFVSFLEPTGVGTAIARPPSGGAITGFPVQVVI